MTNTTRNATAKAIASASEEHLSTKPRIANIKKLYKFIHSEKQAGK